MTLKTEKGFSLPEVLITILIFSFGVLGMAALQIAAMKSNSNSVLVSEATALIEDHISALENTPYGSIAAATESNLGSDGKFTRTTTVQEDTPLDGLKTVTVSVTWTDTKTHTQTFTTIIAEKIAEGEAT